MRFIEISVGGAPSRVGGSRMFLPSLRGIGGSYKAKDELCHPSVVLFGARLAHKSGRRSRVNRSASARRQAATLAWSPDSSTSGIGLPSKVWGRVYWGYSSRDSEKLSSAEDSALPITPGRSRTQASINAMAAS